MRIRIHNTEINFQLGRANEEQNARIKKNKIKRLQLPKSMRSRPIRLLDNNKNHCFGSGSELDPVSSSVSVSGLNRIRIQIQEGNNDPQK